MNDTRRCGRDGTGGTMLLSAAALLALAATIALPCASAAYQQQIEGAAGRVGEAMTRASRKTVAVVDFTDLQGNVTELGRFLAEQLSVALGSRGGAFETIDRNHLRALLQEHKLSATGLIDPLTARKVGEIAGAECLVSGSITPFSESVNLSIKLLDTSTAKILGGTTVDIPRTSTINELLAKGVLSQLLVDQSTPVGLPPGATRVSGNAEVGTVSEVVAGIQVSITECRKTGRTAECQGVLRNLSEDRLSLWVAGSPEIVDDLGNRSRGEADFGPAGYRSSSSIELEPDLPVKFWVREVDVVTEATILSVRVSLIVGPPGSSVMGFGSRMIGGSGTRQAVVVLRNIRLR